MLEAPSNSLADSTALFCEQQKTLAAPRRRYGFLASLLFITMNLIYGRKRSLTKFRVLEIIARVPYQAWENVAYVAMTHTHARPAFARRIFEFVRESRAQQDNEQWHLLILEELVHAQGKRDNWLLDRILPQIIALFYYHTSWLLYAINPRLSYGLNADFEDHAEHEYMEFVEQNPSLETLPFSSAFEADYGSFACQADLFRRIGLDERLHKDESLVRMAEPRFR